MDDLISREALKKAIAVARTNYNTCPEYNELFKYFSVLVGAMIDEMPTVDAVEVVRCKDCIACDRPPFPPTIKLEHGCWCVINDHIVSLDDFCSYGETVDGKCLRETADNKDRREAAEQDAYEQLCNLGNPEDGSL